MAEHHPGPRSIYLVRHGEKPPGPAGPGAAGADAARGVDRTGLVDDHALTPRGWQRAGALTAFFAPVGSPARNPAVHPPTVLFAPDYGSPAESARHRPHQTLEPLAARLGLAVQTPVAKGDEAELARRHVLAATDADVLVCWEHEHLVAILLAVAGSVPVTPAPHPGLAWPDDRFDVVLALTRDDTGYRFAQLPQLLLDGDSPAPL